MTIPARFFLYLLLLSGFSHGPVAGPLFDAHLHYNAENTEQLTPQQIIRILDLNNISYAVVSSTPAIHILPLYHLAPDRIVPFLGVYRTALDKSNWYQDTGLPGRIQDELDSGLWRGIGELHLFANNRHSPVFRDIVHIASKHRLPLLIHGDPAVIDRVYEIDPGQTVIWAHAGAYPYPDLIADYLVRYPALYIDLSVRDEHIAPNGRLDNDWFELFLRFPGRFLTGVDTYSLLRWQNYSATAVTIRAWLAQLPDDVAEQIAFLNAARLFAKRHGKKK